MQIPPKKKEKKKQSPSFPHKVSLYIFRRHQGESRWYSSLSPLSSLSIIVVIIMMMMMMMRKKKDIHAVVMNFVVFVPSFCLQLLGLLFLQRLFLLLLLLSRLLRHSEQPVEEDGSKRVENDVRPQEAKISPSIIVGNVDR